MGERPSQPAYALWASAGKPAYLKVRFGETDFAYLKLRFAETGSAYLKLHSAETGPRPGPARRFCRMLQWRFAEREMVCQGEVPCLE